MSGSRRLNGRARSLADGLMVALLLWLAAVVLSATRAAAETGTSLQEPLLAEIKRLEKGGRKSQRGGARAKPNANTPASLAPAGAPAAGQAVAPGVAAPTAGMAAASPPASAPETSPAAPAEPTPILVKLKANRGLFQRGDTLEMTAVADQDCYLTLVSIEPSGLATVLFPNEIEPDNRIAAGRDVHIPATTADYTFRLAKPGIESVLAICQATARHPLGMGPDYEQQRFTVLGDWEAFGRVAPEREAAYQAKLAEENKKRARKRRNPEPKVIDPPPGPREAEGRDILLISVEDTAPAAVAPTP